MPPTIDAAAIARQASAITTAPRGARPAMVRAVTERISDLEAQLARQYDWLGENPDDPRVPEFTDRWIADLQHYQAACDALTAEPEATQGRLIA